MKKTAFNPLSKLPEEIYVKIICIKTCHVEIPREQLSQRIFINLSQKIAALEKQKHLSPLQQDLFIFE